MRNGRSYDVSHLNATWVEFVINAKAYPFFVSYSHHCFAKTVQGYNDCESWAYNYPKDPRNFHEKRYKRSLCLPAIIEALPTSITFHARRGSYAVCEITSNDGGTYFYQVVFDLFKVNRKLRLHISSAYLIDERPKIKKVGFERIVKNLISGRPLPKP